jgi:type I restriction enzyme R subunit
VATTEHLIERDLIAKLEDLKYAYRPDIRDRAALEQNFREKFEALNRVRVTDSEFQRLLEQITTQDVFAAAHTLRERNSFERDDGTPLSRQRMCPTSRTTRRESSSSPSSRRCSA